MKLSQISISRPVLATVISLVITLFGAISLSRLPNRELPDVDPPVVSVTTVYMGANPEVIESSITEVLEDEINGIEGIKHITSVSREQVSSITVEFELYRDVDVAAQDVRDRVLRVRSRLPDDAEEPIVAKRDADASPIMWIGLSGRGYSQLEISELAERMIKDRLQTLPGVASVIIGGERRYSIRVWLDSPRLTAHRLTVSDVMAALRRESVDMPSGRIEGGDREFTVRTLGELDEPAAFNRVVVANIDGQLVRLSDVGWAEAGAEDDRKLVRFDGKPAVGLGIVKQSKANTLDVARAVKAELGRLEGELPAGVSLEVAFDSSRFIDESIRDVRDALFEAFILVVLVIYLFLRTLRATMIPLVAIPVSIVGTFTVLYAVGFTINTLTLMGLTLAIGLVVDDAIVVLENNVRWLEMGVEPMQAARRSIDEIAFAVVVTTISLVAVFAPLTFLTDTTGRLFREFGIAVAAAVIISGVVALTLSPTLGARVLAVGGKEAGVKALLARLLEGAANSYRRFVGAAVLRWRAVLVLGGVWVALGLFLLRVMPREFIPLQDRGSVLVFTEAPEGSTLSFTDRYQRQTEAIMMETPEVANTFSVIALGLGTPGLVNQGAFFSMLKPRGERRRAQKEVVEELWVKMGRVAGINAYPVNPRPLGQSMEAAPLAFVLQGFELAELDRYAKEILARASKIPGLYNLRSDLRLNKPELRVTIDRDRASDLGVSVEEVARTLQILLGALDVTTFKRRGKEYKVMVQARAQDRASPFDIYGFYVRGRDGQLVPLASVVGVERSASPRAINHFDRSRAVTITANLLPGFALGPALEKVQRVAEEVLPRASGFRTSLAGESEQFVESGRALLFAYLLAVLVVYLVLAAQFESFLHPITILVSVLLSFTGALVTLIGFGQTLNLFSEIGLIMLIGLVTKNSILIVEFANQLRGRGMALGEAVVEAAAIRFRPILMTALSTIAGIMPIALGLGAGGEGRMPLGIAVVGGMFFATLLTFFVVPAAYVGVEVLRGALVGLAKPVVGRRRQAVAE